MDRNFCGLRFNTVGINLWLQCFRDKRAGATPQHADADQTCGYTDAARCHSNSINDHTDANSANTTTVRN